MIVIGSVFVDVKGIPEGTYLPGGRNAGRVEQVHGGVARNMAAEIARQNAPKKCPACGAMTKGDVCEYCGAALYENK